MQNFSLRDVFTAGGFPVVTYVDRKHLNLEEDLRRAVNKGYSIIAVTGPSKSGKTVLCYSVISEEDSINIDGGQIKYEDSFWELILAKLNTASISSESSTRISMKGSTGEGAANLAIASGKIAITSQETTTSTQSRIFPSSRQIEAISALRKNHKSLIIDDFHYIDPIIRRNIVRALKPEVFKGLTVVAISVPYKAFSVIDAESEMEGRFKHIEIVEWSPVDLIEIASKGRRALNISISDRIVSEFAEESSGNPLLMQSFLYDACESADIQSTLAVHEDISHKISPHQVYITTAKDVGLPIFKKLSQGPQSRSSRIDRPFANGHVGDTYEAILAAMAVTGPTREIHYDDLRNGLKQVLADKYPQKNEVTSAIRQMVDIAKEMNNENPAIDYDNENDIVFVQNPFFRFYLRWMHRPLFS